MEAKPSDDDKQAPYPLDTFEGFSITELSQEYGTEGLKEAIIDEVEFRIRQETFKDRIVGAMALAEEIHADQIRTNGPYVDHVLRVALRIMWKYEVYDEDVIVASLLHDAVEDQPEKLASMHPEVDESRSDDDAYVRETAFDALEELFGTRATGMIREMTFVYDESLEATKQEQYEQYAKDIIRNHPGVRIIKLSDFVDNAVGNHFTIGKKRLKLAKKYAPLFPEHIKGVISEDSLLREDIQERICEQLAAAEEANRSLIEAA